MALVAKQAKEVADQASKAAAEAAAEAQRRLNVWLKKLQQASGDGKTSCRSAAEAKVRTRPDKRAKLHVKQLNGRKSSRSCRTSSTCRRRSR